MDNEINYIAPNFSYLKQEDMTDLLKDQWLSIATYSNFRSGSFSMLDIKLLDHEGNIFTFSNSDISNYPMSI